MKSFSHSEIPAKQYKFYEKYVKHFTDRLENVPITPPLEKTTAAEVLAQIFVILTCKELLDKILERIEQDLAAEIKNSGLKIQPLKPKRFETYRALRWPFPTPELTSQTFNRVAHKFILKKEQAYGLNLTGPEGKELVAIFGGFIDKNSANGHLDSWHTWREALTHGLLFHGKDTHRWQLLLFMYAIELGFIHIPFEKPFQIIYKLLLANNNATNKPLWDEIMDTVISAKTDNFVITRKHINKHPWLEDVVGKKFNTVLRAGEKVFCYDPYYFHNYLINSPNEFLSSCAISAFAKSVIKVNRIQNKIGYLVSLSPDKKKMSYTRKNNITMEETLKEHEQFYNTVVHTASLDPAILATENYKNGYTDMEEDCIIKKQHLEIINGKKVAIAQLKGHIFWKNKEPLPKKTNTRNYQRSFLEISSSLTDNAIEYLINWKLLTGEQINTLSPKEIYEKFLESMAKVVERVKKEKTLDFSITSYFENLISTYRDRDVTNSHDASEAIEWFIEQGYAAGGEPIFNQTEHNILTL